MKNIIVLDTETANSLECPLCYDIGWAVINLDTQVTLKTESFTIAETFLDKELMTSAYYAEKLPKYWEEIKAGNRKLKRLYNIKNALYADCELFEVKEIYAHNAMFDNRSCNTTQRYHTKSKYRYFFPYGIKICDTLKMARQAFKEDESYKEFCHENDYITKNNQVRLTAEILYRYISGKNDFNESHTGLEDVMIEKEILFECLRRGVTNGALWED